MTDSYIGKVNSPAKALPTGRIGTIKIPKINAAIPITTLL